MTPLDPRHTARLLCLLGGRRRCLLGLVGAPGSGKSTLARVLQAACPEPSVVVPMDGFHLANSELQRLGRSGRKGAPDTFDSAGYLALLRRLRAANNVDAGAGADADADEQPVYAPDYRRGLEEAVAGAIAVPASIRLVITEGNYLLLQDGPWAGVRGQLDEVWYVDVDPALRRQRLLARHVRHGRSPEQALAWIAATDEPNAVRIAACRPRADWLIDWNGELPA